MNAPLFIGGSGRSGTTLVVDMLGLHSQLSPIYETAFVVPLAAMVLSKQGPEDVDALGQMVGDYMQKWAAPLPHRPHNKGQHERYFHGPHYILLSREFIMDQVQTMMARVRSGGRLAAFRDFLLTLFSHHAQLDGKPIWINKHPGYVKAVDFLKAVFPAMKFIHCVRDGRDVALSVISRDWGPNSFEEAASWWLDALKPGFAFEEKHPAHCLNLGYEILISQTAEVLPQVFAWLGLKDETPQILARYQGPEGPSLDTIRMGRWRDQASADDIARFDAIAGTMLSHLGYPRS